MQEYPGALGELCRATKHSALDSRFALGIEQGEAALSIDREQRGEQSTVSPRSSVTWISRAHLCDIAGGPLGLFATPRRSRRARRNRICLSSHTTSCH